MQLVPTFKSTLELKDINKGFLRIIAGRNSNKYCHEFKSLLGRYLGIKNVAFVPSGRWGLYFILKNLGIPPGSEIILSDFNYYAVPSAVIRAGMKPVFVDIKENSLNIDIDKVKDLITEKTRVLIVTHLCGFVCDMEGASHIAKKYGLILIEDCAQAFGAEYGDIKTGCIGDFSFFTFGLTKNFTTLGGGAIVAKDREKFVNIESDLLRLKPNSYTRTLLQIVSAYGIVSATTKIFFPLIYSAIVLSDKFGLDILDRIFKENETSMGEIPRFGLMNGIQSEIGINQLFTLDGKNELRTNKGLKLYRELKNVKGIMVPRIEEKAKNIFVSCPVLAKDRNRLKRLLLRHGIVVSYGFMCNCSNHKLFLQYRNNCLNAERASKEIIYLPMHSWLSDKELEHAANCIKNNSS